MHIGVARLPPDRGAEINAVDNTGRIPLAIAVHYRNADLAHLLEEMEQRSNE